MLSERGIDGHGCYDSLGEVKAGASLSRPWRVQECHNSQECPARDCARRLPHRDGGAEVWGEWTQWSYCSKSCVRALGLDREAVQEGGIRSRRRHVLTAWVLMEACDLRCRGAKPPREAGLVCYERARALAGSATRRSKRRWSPVTRTSASVEVRAKG